MNNKLDLTREALRRTPLPRMNIAFAATIARRIIANTELVQANNDDPPLPSLKPDGVLAALIIDIAMLCGMVTGLAEVTERAERRKVRKSRF
jgi:hypothetical protein